MNESSILSSGTMTPGFAGSSPATPANKILPFSLMVERPALTRNAEVRHLEGQPI